MNIEDMDAKNVQVSKMDEWKEQRINFYKNSNALEFIKDYMNVKKGVRLTIGHCKDMIKYGYDPTRYITDYQKFKTRPLTIPDSEDGSFHVLKNYWCVHSSMYTFNEDVTHWINVKNHTSTLENNRCGINAVIDLDTPDDPTVNIAKRLTFFDHIEEFNNVINKIDKKLEDEGQEYNLMFSGNGIYFILNGYYEDNFLVYRDNFVNTIDYLKENGLENKLRVHIDNKSAAWSVYTKIPFTFHDKRNRISIPLPKGEIDKNWLDEASNPDNIMKDYNIINEIIKKAKWKKIW